MVKSTNPSHNNDIAEVFILRRTKALSEPFDYRVPEKFISRLQTGNLVKVPFGKSQALGVIVNFKAKSELEELKEINEFVEKGPSLPEHAIYLTNWMADYYAASFAECLSLFLPVGFSFKLVKVIKVASSEDKENPVTSFLLRRGGSSPYKAVENKFGKQAEQLVSQAEEKGLIKIYWVIPRRKVKPKKTYDLRIAEKKAFEELLKKTRSHSLKASLELLKESGVVSYEEIKEEFGVKLSQLRRAESKGAIYLSERRVYRKTERGMDMNEHEVTLSEKQKKALDEIKKAIDLKEFRKFLLFGVTGSGKTEVYLRAARHVISRGGTVIYLVPEISLTPQTVARVERVFGKKVAVFHSGMKSTERLDEWASVQSGIKNIVIGPRSALFAPLENVGLVVIDEEHEQTYKQESPPYYDARRAAVELARYYNAVVVFGSATPSVERMYEALNLNTGLLKLPERMVGNFPRVELIDLRKDKKAISDRLKKELTGTLKRNEKAILFLNRRGYAVIQLCKSCGYYAQCDNCSVALRYHSDREKLICHYCGEEIPPYKKCPECESDELSMQGTGIQKLEKEIEEVVNNLESIVVRMDSDITRKGKGREELIKFTESNSSVLVGTQMVAKGLHFPDVTLVGVVNSDVGLHIPDFRAEERTYQMLMQVFGRAGRGTKKGKVILQTWDPGRDVIRFAVDGDYWNFYRHEVVIRKIHNYPPFSRLIRIITVSKDKNEAMDYAEKIAKEIKKDAEKPGELIGPVPAPFEKLRGKYRFHMVIKAKKEPSKDFVNKLREMSVVSKKGIRVVIDIDPVSLL